MCGIAGILNLNNAPAKQEILETMMSDMKHRGPDDEGLYIKENIGFGFVRLSILDLSATGHQPMFDSSGQYLIIHNGEVYNYIELRKQLEIKGYSFKSNTDTEVILYSFIEWGQDCLHKFNGMWAFAIYDIINKTVFISRDRYGIKPLYYYHDDNHFVFASEIPPILNILKKYYNILIEPDNQSIFDYLVFNRTDQTESTFFLHIKKLQHGCNIEIANHKVSNQQWYKLSENIGEPFSSVGDYQELLSSAIGLRLRSDVPVGVCLSGGLDSSSITSILLKDHNKKDLKTFSAVYGVDQYGDESVFIDEYRNQIELMHFITPSAETLLNDIPSFVRTHGEPVPSTSPYAHYKVMELAKNNVVVTLDGQGADESLAGYHYFFGYHFKDLLLNFKLFQFTSELTNYFRNHKSLYGLKTMAFFFLPKVLQTKTRISEKGYLTNEFANGYRDGNVIAGQLYNAKTLNQALLNHFEYKLEHLLKWEDRNSMHFSLESRVPFLDHRLVEKTLALPADKVIKNGMTKSILRKAMKNIIPKNICERKDKIGFGTPADNWFRENHFQDLIKQIIYSDSFNNRNIIDPKQASALYRKHIKNKIQASSEIWKMINLELWFREFID